MPNFRYKARDRLGKAVTGLMEGPSREMVGSRLGELGLIPILVMEERPKSPSPSLNLFQRLEKVKVEDMVLFNRQLATMIHAGIPITASLATLSEQTKSKKLSRILKDVVQRIEGGSSFSEALASHPSVFSELYTNMIKAGETGGVLEEVLERLATLTEKEADTKAKIKTATRYPKIVVAAIGVAFFIVMTYVVPRFANMFSKAKVTLPLPTRILLAFNDFLHQYWYIGVLILVAIVLAFKSFLKTEKGKTAWDNFKLKVPIFGPLYTKIILSRFARMLGVLNRSGVPILTNLKVVSRVLNNSIVSQIVLNLRNSVERGESIAEPLRNSRIFTPMIVHMISIGEKSGSLDEMLFKASDFYDAEVDNAVKNLSSMIEPLLIFFIGAMVLLLGLGIFMPMWDMSTLAGRF